MRYLLLSLFLFVSFFIYCQDYPYSGFTKDNTEIPSGGMFWEDNIDDVALVDRMMQNMTDDEILGQIFLTSWTSDSVSVDIERWIRRGLGGLKIFGWNVSTLDKLTKTVSELQSNALSSHLSIPLIVATDQEGGWVRHIKDKTSLTPGNLSIGATGLPYDAYYSALYIGEELRNLGVNMNLAPTVDIYESLNSDVIGPRAFSSNPKQGAMLSVSYFHGLEANKIIATAKHFPGHGDTSEDSHGSLPTITKTIDELWNYDFLPYRTLIRNKLPSIMVGHLRYPNLSNDDVPASLSKKIIQDIIRDKLGFDGVLITDDMYMSSMQTYANRRGWNMPRLIVESQKAGMNFMLLSRLPPDREYDEIRSYYKSDAEFQTAVKDSCKRILKMKLTYLKDKDRVPLTPSNYDVYNKIPSRMGQEFFKNQAIRSATIILGKNQRIPFNEDSKDILVISQDPEFIQITKEFFPDVKVFRYSSEYRLDNAKSSDITQAVELSKKSKFIIFNLVNPKSLSMLQALRDYREKLIVISSLTPALIKDAKWVQTAIAVYGWSKNEYRAGYFVLTGKVQARGKLPLDIE